jgi:hypothetical protein
MVKTYCDEYYKQVVRAGDYNILGQALRLLCQLEKTDFNDDESINLLGIIAKDAGEKIKELGESIRERYWEKEKLESVS